MTTRVAALTIIIVSTAVTTAAEMHIVVVLEVTPQDKVGAPVTTCTNVMQRHIATEVRPIVVTANTDVTEVEVSRIVSVRMV